MRKFELAPNLLSVKRKSDPAGSGIDVLDATSIDSYVCDHGSLWVRLFDDKGRCFSIAVLEQANALAFLEGATAQMQHVIGGGQSPCDRAGLHS